MTGSVGDNTSFIRTMFWSLCRKNGSKKRFSHQRLLR